MMNKKILLEQLIAALENVHLNAVVAATRAHETATDNENIAENKYDTLAVEAAYLAHGQSVRVEQCAADIAAFKSLHAEQSYTSVSLGALVLLLDEHDNEKWLFFGPCAGGLKVAFEGKSIMVVTASSPLGEVLEQTKIEQEISVNIAGKKINYEVIDIH
ncbi:transcription elongation factor [Psychromonas marina]|uniref:Transcription elongation factor n=1 Tax=Psychromonas marina TaxID=88364 RepID=A0ABQ6DVR5_9GAMM|nr:transcription elongation factor [Psychromonas marina]GLS89197.1 transcription elongation factor [Psychromonas marina]